MSADQSVRSPNIVVIMADDLGFGDLGRFSGGSVQTPTIDSLARDGMTLTQHYSASPICAPARAAFLTGRYPQRSGVIDTFPHRRFDQISLREQTLADRLSEAGYMTGLVGKWHNGALGREYHPTSRGFDEFTGFRGGGQDYWDWRLEGSDGPFYGDGRYITDVFTEAAVDFVERNAADPFFLMVAYTAPHGPFQAPEEALHRVRARRGSGPILVDTIAAMVEEMDRGIGEILSALDRTGVAEDTLVLFTSDNGPWMRPGTFEETTVRYNLGLAGGKEHVLEGGVRVPAILRWPDAIPSGTTRHEPVHFVDWLPTLLALAGAEPGPLPLDGADVSPILHGEAWDRHPFWAWQWSRYQPHGRVNSAIRDGTWKLVYPANSRALLIMPEDQREERRMRADPDAYELPPDPMPKAPPIEGNVSPRLYNIERDPAESLDLSVAEAERLRMLAGRLDEWFAEMESDRRSALAFDLSAR